ncbi:MAG: SurA N-terminal domain-containing protein [Gammaproteobacteria bacterium]|nr:SurA N-terminal domain-containing protein [Gammaproteobacteria bacterium]
MLQRIRENTTGWVAWFVIIFLSIPFAFWGINQYFTDASGGVAAEVNGTEIPIALLDQAYQRRYNELVRMFGDQLPPNLINEQALRREQLERLIMEEIMEQEAKDLRLRVDDVTLQQAIRSLPTFQVDGQFSPERYRSLLAYNNQTPTGFETGYRRDLGLQQLQRGLSESGFATEREVARLVALQDQRRRHEVISIPDEMFRDSIELSDEDVQAYYEANTDRFMTEETVDIAYISLDQADYAESVSIDEEELREAYQLRASDYASQEERVARHILIEGDGEEAMNRAREIRAELEAGADFAELASKYSDDPVSAEEGGSLGEIARGQLEGPFEDALFSLEEGEISDPVQTDFGVHIIKLDEIQAPELPEFADIRDQLEADLRERKVADQFEADVQQLADITFAEDGTLVSAADEFDIEIQEIEGVTRGAGEGLASRDEIRQAAFSEIVLGENRNSDPIRLDDGAKVVVLRVVEHDPSEPKPLAEVDEQVRAQLLDERAREMAKAKAESVLEAVRGGEPMESVAQSEGLAYRAPSVTTRNDSDISRSYAAALFTADYPQDGPVYGMTGVEDRDFVVYSVLEVMPGDYEDLTAAERQQRLQALRQQEANAELAAYLAELRRSADVTIFEKNLKNETE